MNFFYSSHPQLLASRMVPFLAVEIPLPSLQKLRLIAWSFTWIFRLTWLGSNIVLSFPVLDGYTAEEKTCPHCGRVYRWKKGLDRHLQECGQEPKFRCPFCEHRSKRKENLTKHMIKKHPSQIAEPVFSTVSVIKPFVPRMPAMPSVISNYATASFS